MSCFRCLLSSKPRPAPNPEPEPPPPSPAETATTGVAAFTFPSLAAYAPKGSSSMADLREADEQLAPTGLTLSALNLPALAKKDGPLTLKDQFYRPLNNCLVALRTDYDLMVETLVENNLKIKTLITDFLNESQQNLEKDGFVSPNLLSHELRAPLQEISGRIESYRLDPGSQTLAQLAYSLNPIYKIMQLLVDRLPNIGSGEKHQLTMEYEAFTLPKVEKYLKTLTNHLAQTKGIHISYNFPDLRNGKDKPQAYSGDFTKLIQVLLNFTNNAIKFQAKNIDITMEIELGSAPPEYIVKLSVKDDGPGISPEKQKELFGLFSKAGSIGDSSMESSGVGLYLCIQFVKVMNPNSQQPIGVTSALGKGSTFWFTSVVKRIPDSEAPVSGSPVAGPALFKNKNLTTLWADDSTSTRKIMNRLLEVGSEKTGNHLAAANGEEAVELCKANNFDVIFLDQNMGDGMAGTDAAKVIIQNARDKDLKLPHIVIVSGDSELEIQNKLHPFEKEVRFLPKPTEYADILALVDSLS